MTNTSKTATKPMKLKLYEGAAAINKAIDGVIAKGKAWQTEVHKCALSCINHAQKHGDITLMQRLIDGMPGASRKNALILWATFFGPFLLDEETSKLKHRKRVSIDLIAAAAEPFWEFTVEPTLKPFDLAKALDRVITEFRKHQVKPVDGEVLDTRKLDILENLRKTVEPLDA